MPDTGQPANRIDELRQRFEEQPDSRVYLQLADEYRRLGLPEEAIGVLEQGLAKRPKDLSGLVALGRCRLEVGQVDDALEVLEGVISRDAAHLVANKLLIEAYLRQGEADKARQRLELYKLLNDRDPEIEELEARLKETQRSAREEARASEAPTVKLEELAAEAAAEGTPEAEANELPEASFEELPAASLEELPEASFEELPATGSGAEDPLFELEEDPAAPQPAAPEHEASEPSASEPFGPLPGPADVESLRHSLEHGVLFPLSMEAFLPPPAPELEAPEPAAPEEPEPVEESAPEETPAIPLETEELPVGETVGETVDETVDEAPDEESETRAVEQPDAAELPPLAEAAAGEIADGGEEAESATVTLAELYLKQGHVEEAVRIYHRVLERDPGNEAALRAIEELAAEGRAQASPGLTAAQLLAELPAGEVPAGLTAKKVLVLNAYKQRLRRHHVR